MITESVSREEARQTNRHGLANSMWANHVQREVTAINVKGYPQKRLAVQFDGGTWQIGGQVTK